MKTANSEIIAECLNLQKTLDERHQVSLDMDWNVKDEDEQSKTIRIMKSIGKSIQRIKILAEGRLDSYNDSEVIILANQFMSVYSESRSAVIDSSDFGLVCGFNPDKMTKLIIDITVSRTSPILEYLTVYYRRGTYRFEIQCPVRLSKLFIS